MKQFLVSLLVLLFIFPKCTKILAQSPAQPPVPSGPTNITKILEKPGQFKTLIQLFGITKMGDQINTALNDTNQGLTLLAPTDSAFSSLKTGTLNSLTDEQKSELVQFHVIPSFLSISQFQTVSNPLRTQAGNNNAYQFPLNVTTYGNQVNVSTGISNATVASTIYTDNQLAVYQVDNVLLPWSIFGPQPPAPAPSLSKPKNKSPVADSSTSGGNGAVDASNAVSLTMHRMMVSIGVAMIIAAFSL